MDTQTDLPDLVSFLVNTTASDRSNILHSPSPGALPEAPLRSSDPARRLTSNDYLALPNTTALLRARFEQIGGQLPAPQI